ncbi:hypothetical protein A2153_00735 [Candidatus Gottesmanbacteria bacterium RBG_16_38_7b]|nr:MAG: hypothetical protein A2153_00735 [Candidatus Gottesmanbacteria bacterium RBG_16_38_7b]
MIIRQAVYSDLEQIINLSTQLLELHSQIDPEYYQYTEDYTVKIRSWAERHLTSPSQFILVAEEEQLNDKKIIGFISGYIKFLFPWYKINSVGHISFLVIDTKFQKKGVGRQLEEAAKRWFRTRNLKYIEVYTSEKNSAGLSAWKAYSYQPFNKFLRKKISS